MLLAVDVRTLKQWQAGWEHDRLSPQPLGAPAIQLGVATRQRITDLILLYNLANVGIGGRILHDLFPELPRRALEDLLAGIRDDHHDAERQETYHAIHWIIPGTIWAIDYTFPLLPVDGAHPAILTVRDLASGCILLAEPCRHADAAHVVFHLHRLIAAHGAPLVLKADNGSHFTAAPVSALLQQHRIAPLFSPVYTPAFNGAVEADQGHLKARAGDLARRDDLPQEPSSSHYHAARDLINRTRGTGWRGELPSAEARFANRQPITERQRAIFERHLENLLSEFAHEAQQALDDRLGQHAAAAQQGDASAPAPARKISSDVLHRRAVAEAMKASGLYTTRRRLVRLPLPARISA